MSANDLLTTIAQIARDLLNADTWRIVLLLLVAWGVHLLFQIRRLLSRLVLEVELRAAPTPRGEAGPLDDITLS